MGTYKHRFKLAYFYRVNIFHLVLPGYANQTYNFTNLVFLTDDVITLFSIGLEQFNDASVSHHISSHLRILIFEKDIAILRQKKNSAISTSKWNYSLLYSHFEWDEDSEQTHAQLQGLVCTHGSATCIASWALYHKTNVTW